MKLDKMLDELMKSVSGEIKGDLQKRVDVLNNTQTIQEHCKEFVRLVTPDHLKGTLIEQEYVKAYYGGVGAILSRILAAQDEDEFTRVIEDAQNALNNFSASMLLKYATPGGNS